MAYRKTLVYKLVHHLKISHKDAKQLIVEGKVLVNGLTVDTAAQIELTDEIIYEGKVIQHPIIYKYIAFNKPRGVECTLNKNIENNLNDHIKLEEGLFNIGRLDKDSEGLLLFSNDPKFYDLITESNFNIEKEYYVEVDKIITNEMLCQLREGIVIMGQKTLPAEVEKVNDKAFKIILIQGLNRQIRRMCRKIGFEVTRLERIRIGEILLGELSIGTYRVFDSHEIGYTNELLNN